MTRLFRFIRNLPYGMAALFALALPLAASAAPERPSFPMDGDAFLENGQLRARQRVAAGARQPDDRVPAPGLASLDRLEQVGVGAVDQLQVDGQGGVEVSQYRAVHGNAVVAFRLQLFEYVPVHGVPFGLRGNEPRILASSCEITYSERGGESGTRHRRFRGVPGSPGR